MPSPLTPFINKALAQPQKPTPVGSNANGKGGVSFQGGVQPAPLATGSNTFSPAAGDALSGPQTNAVQAGASAGGGQGLFAGQSFGGTPAGTQSGVQYEGQSQPISAANKALLGEGSTGTTATTNPFLTALSQASPQEQAGINNAFNQEQSLAQLIGGPAAQQQLSDAMSTYAQGNIQNALTGIEGQQSIDETQSTGNENLLQAGLANQISQQQLGLQEQYNPQLYAITQGQEALQGQGLTLTQEGIQQQAGQADNALQQQIQQNYGNEAASGAVGTYGTKNAYAQDQYNHAQQIQSLLRQGKQVGLQQAGLGLTEKQSAIQEKETQAGYGISQEQIDNVAQRIGFDTKDLQTRIGNAMSNLGISQALTSDQIIQAMSDTMSGIPNQLSTVLPYILQTANIPAGPFSYSGYSAQPSVGATTP